MKKKILIGIVIFLFLGVIGRSALAGIAVSGTVKAVTGLRLDMKLNVGLFKPMIRIRQMKLYNPAGFSQPVMMDMPELDVTYDLKAFLGGGVHLPDLFVDLKEFNVERNAKGELNIDALKFVQEKKQRGNAPPPVSGDFDIDKFRLRVGHVTFKDASINPPRNADFVLNTDESYTGVKSPQLLGTLIVTRALTKTAIARLANFDINGLVQDMSGSVKKVSNMATGLVNTTVGTGVDAGGQAVDTLKGLLPFEKKEEEKKTE